MGGPRSADRTASWTLSHG